MGNELSSSSTVEKVLKRRRGEEAVFSKNCLHSTGILPERSRCLDKVIRFSFKKLPKIREFFEKQ